MAEASAGKDSVTGHWEMMGVVLDRPFPVFPERVSAGRSSQEFSRLTGRGVLGNKAASGTGDHRRARRRAHAHRRAHRLHVGRQRVSDRGARRDRAGAGAVSRLRDRLHSWSVEGLGVGRVIARPFVGAPGQLHADRQPPRLRAAARPARRCSIA